MSSIRERIVTAAVAALDGPGKPAGLAVHRHRHRPIDGDQLPAQVVFLAAEDVGETESTTLHATRRLRLRVESRIVVGAGSPHTLPPADEALDPYVTWAVRALMADQQLGGLAIQTIERRTVWDAEELNRLYAAAVTEFEVVYQTAFDDPEAP